MSKFYLKIFEDKVIYSLIDNYNGWVEEDTAHEEDAVFAEFTRIYTNLKIYIP
jgi:translation initiation factor 5B